MDTIANDLSRFDQDIVDFQRAQQDLVNNYEMLVNHMNELSSMWEGEAHDQFLQTFDVDSKRTQQLCLLLKEIYNELRYAHTEYATCENKVASYIENLAV